MSGCIRWDSDKSCKLSKIDPSEHGGITEEEANAEFCKLSDELRALQDVMYGACMNGVLIVFQAMDTGGKDGAIKNVMGSVNAQSCTVTSFKAPTPIELDHDFLWRVHAVTPRSGHFAIFNRSHYEDVLITRVHKLVPKDVWKSRYKDIVHFEELLTDANTIVMKFYLHISKGEQAERLRKREEDPEKAWKLSAADWHEREKWEDYMDAYEDVITKTSKPNAPWYVVPANHKWYRDLIIEQTIVETLRPYRPKWEKKLHDIGEDMKKQLAEMRDKGESNPKPVNSVSG